MKIFSGARTFINYHVEYILINNLQSDRAEIYTYFPRDAEYVY